MELKKGFLVLENGDEEEDEKEQKPKKDVPDLHSKIIEFFTKNPNPSDDTVHDFAESLGLPPDGLEEHIYKLLTTFISKVGKHKDVPDDKYDSKELAMGIEVEMEHTDDKDIAKEISKDHLDEIKDYYTRLKKMEDEAMGKKEK